MNIKERLSARISLNEIQEIISLINYNDLKKRELFNLLFDSNDKIAFQAAWVMSHFSSKDNKWLYSKQDELINEVLICKDIGKRRLILTLLYQQPLVNLRVDFLDFCFERMITEREPLAIQSLCMKMAYELCRPTPELMQELRTALEMMEGELSPAIYAAKRNILKAMQKGKSLQPFK